MKTSTRLPNSKVLGVAAVGGSRREGKERCVVLVFHSGSGTGGREEDKGRKEGRRKGKEGVD